MNLKIVLILLGLLVFAIAALLLTQDDRVAKPTHTDPTTHDRSTTDDKAAAQPLLTEQELDARLNRIAFDLGPAGRPFVLSRTSGKWRVEKPHDFSADPGVIDELFAVLSGLEGKPIDAAPPSTNESLKLTLRLGDETIQLRPAGRLGGGLAVITVVRGTKKQHYAADDTLHDLFDALEPTVFYAMALDPPLMTDIGQIQITSHGVSSSLTQSKGQWWIGEPANQLRAWEQGEANYPGVNDFFELLRTIQIVEHRSYTTQKGSADLARFGLNRPQHQAVLIPHDADPSGPASGWAIRVGVPADPADQTRFVSFGRANDPHPAVFTVASPFARAIGQPATRFRDPRLIATPPTLIASVGLRLPEQPEQTITFNRDGSADLSTAGQDNPIKLPAIRSATLLERLAHARALTSIEQGLEDHPLIKRVDLTSRVGGASESFTIYRDRESRAEQPTVLIRRGMEPVLLRVSRVSVELLIDPSLFATE